jgi:hypothetical protein
LRHEVKRLAAKHQASTRDLAETRQQVKGLSPRAEELKSRLIRAFSIVQVGSQILFPLLARRQVPLQRSQPLHQLARLLLGNRPAIRLFGQ